MGIYPKTFGSSDTVLEKRPDLASDNSGRPNGTIDNGLRPARIIWRIIALSVLAVLILIVAIALANSHSKPLNEQNPLSDDDVTQKIWWRVRLYARKATGGVPELSWSDLWQMTRHPGGFGLEMSGMGVSPSGSLVNPYKTHGDHEAGARIFLQRCAMCHGMNGVGRNGPPLNHPGLKHGDSDLAIYDVLKDGIPGTAMVSPDLSPVQRWQVIGK